MKTLKRIDTPMMLASGQAKSILFKNWISMGILSVTVVSGLTLWTTVASAQTPSTVATSSNVMSAVVSTDNAAASSASGTNDSVSNPTGVSKDVSTSSSKDVSTNAITSPSSLTSSSTSSNSSLSSNTSPNVSTNANPNTSTTTNNAQTNNSTPTTIPLVDQSATETSNDNESQQGSANVNETTAVPDQSDTTKRNAVDSTADVSGQDTLANVVEDENDQYWIQDTNAQSEGSKTQGYTQLTDYSYALNSDGVTYSVTGYTGALQRYLAGNSIPQGGYVTSIVIPDTYNGQFVTAVADYAFDNLSAHDQLQIVTALTNVTLGSHISSIGTAAFAGNQITGEVVIPDSVLSIGDDAYADNQITGVTLGSNAWFTGDGTFANNLITHLDLGSGVTLIGKGTFANNQLTTVTIPAQIGIIDDNAFSNNRSLTTVNFADDSQLTGIGTAAFESDSIQTLKLPDSAKNIGDDAFADNALTVLSLDQQATTIGTKAFSGNQLGGTITFPDSVTNIGDNAFSNNDISAIVLGSGLQTIGTNAFENNDITGTLTIPDNVTSIGERAFADNHITALNIGSGVQTIADGAFAENFIDQVATALPSDSDHYLVGLDFLAAQQAFVTVPVEATATQIKNVKAAIENVLKNGSATGIALPDDLTFIDNQGRQWQYDAATDSLTTPDGQMSGDQLVFQFNSDGSGSYGTTHLIFDLTFIEPISKSASAAAVYATTITLKYQTADGVTRGTAILVGNSGTEFAQSTIIDHLPTGLQLTDSLNTLPQLIAGLDNQTIIIPVTTVTPDEPTVPVTPLIASQQGSNTIGENQVSFNPITQRAVVSNNQYGGGQDSDNNSRNNAGAGTQTSDNTQGGHSEPETLNADELAGSDTQAVRNNLSKQSVATTLPQTTESNTGEQTSLVGALLLNLLSWLGFLLRTKRRD